MKRRDDDVHKNETYEARRNPVMDDGTGDDEREIAGVAKWRVRAGPEGPMRGSRATPVPTWRWRRRRWVASPKPLGAWGPRSGERWERGRPSDEQLSLDPARARRERRAAVDLRRLGEGVLRRPGTTVPSSSTVTRWSLVWMAASARDAACSFWTGRLSVARGAQLPQCVGAHVSLGNSGAHSWLRWSVTLQLLPVQSHVLEHLRFPVLDHGWRRSWINVLISLRIQLESRSSHAGCSLLLDKRGRGPRKKSAKARTKFGADTKLKFQNGEPP